jgi:hypothetical protein
MGFSYRFIMRNLAILYTFLILLLIRAVHSEEEFPQDITELTQLYENKENELNVDRCNKFLEKYASTGKKNLVEKVLNPPPQKLMMGRTRANPKPDQSGINKAFVLSSNSAILKLLIDNGDLKPDQTAIDDKFQSILNANISSDNKLKIIEELLKSEVIAERAEIVNNLFSFLIDILSHRMQNKSYNNTWSKTIDKIFKDFLEKQTVKPENDTLVAGFNALVANGDRACLAHLDEMVSLLNIGINFANSEDFKNAKKIVRLLKDEMDADKANVLVRKFNEHNPQPQKR